MKKLLVGLFVFVFLAAAGTVGILYYIRPDITLNLEHKPVPVKDRMLDMGKRMSIELALTEEDVNNVLKESLAKNPQRSKDIEVRGARFSLSGDRLIADYHLKWKKRVSTALRVTYRLSWQDPDIIGTVEDVKLKDIGLPSTLVENLSVPIGRELPKPIKIKNVAFGEGQVKILFQKPNLSDLRDLLG